MLSVADGLRAQAAHRPRQPAVICGSDAVTYAQLDQRVDAAAHMLWAEGMRPGDRVAAMLPNGLTIVELLFAAARTGVVLCPINARLQAAEVAGVLQDCRPRLLIAAPALRSVVEGARTDGVRVLWDWPRDDGEDGYVRRREAAARGAFSPQADDEAPWLLVYTSGTTGRPKGALRTQRSDFLVGLTVASTVGVGAGDVGFAVLPLFHVNSIWFVTLSLCIGATCRVHASAQFHPGRMLDDLERSGATYAMFVPTMLGYLADALEAGRTRPSLRVVMTSSAPLDIGVRDRLLRSMPAARFYELYGATELGAATLFHHRPGEVGGSIGFPLPGVRVRLLDKARSPVARGAVGELFVESSMLMAGYYGLPEATEAARSGSCLSVGDLAREDPEGRLHLVDRSADTIITAGENVYPTEVEMVLLSHPAVRLAAVVGLPDARRGEAVAAAVVLREGAETASAELSAWCRGQLADYKCPRTLVVAPDLPLGPTGKVARRLVREAWRAGRFPEKGSQPADGGAAAG